MKLDNKRTIGSLYEQKAADFLVKKGMYILERNFRCRLGEIDIIAKDKNTLVFVEVKYRRNKTSGYSSAAVNHRKQQKIIQVAKYYMQRFPTMDVPCRFDVVAIDEEEITYIADAFWQR